MRPVRHRVSVRTVGETDAAERTLLLSRLVRNAISQKYQADQLQRSPDWRRPRNGGRRSFRAAKTAPREPLHKTTQRGLQAYNYTYPMVVESSREYKLGNRVQPGVIAGAGFTNRRRLPRRGNRVRALQTHHRAYLDTTTSSIWTTSLLGVSSTRCWTENSCRCILMQQHMPAINEHFKSDKTR